MTIFHPTDFSGSSHVAFTHALRIAYELQKDLTIMHVGGGQPRDDWSRFPYVRETLSGWKLVDPDIGQSELEQLIGIRISKIEASGSNPTDVISRYLDEHDVSMVVMATQGRKGMAAMQHPSVARALARKIKRPFLFVRNGLSGFVAADGNIRLKHVLVPVDNEPDPQLAVDEVARLARDLNTRVTVLEALHVGERPLELPLGAPGLPDCDLRSEARPGHPEEVIPAVAEEHRADLIVMVYSGPGTLSEKWLGSTTEQVVRTAGCPVLALPAPEYWR